MCLFWGFLVLLLFLFVCGGVVFGLVAWLLLFSVVDSQFDSFT